MEQIFKDETISRVVFHYNKAHNTDTAIPTWVIKHKGISYYVHHVDSAVGFSTKETPDNEHTKGAIQFRGKLSIVKEGENVTARIY